jgi:hypothetical protein
MDVAHHEHASRIRRWRVLWWLSAGIAAFYLLSEHRAHAAGLLGELPWLFLAACPLMHLFGHGGHGGHGGRPHAERSPLPPDRPGAPDAPVLPPRHEHGAARTEGR